MPSELANKELHRIAVTGIIYRAREGGVFEYLITKRAPHKTWPGKWTVPGGGMHIDDYIHSDATYANAESPQWYGALDKTLRREIREEVNLEVENIEYLLSVAFIRPDQVPCLVLSMYCKYKSGDEQLDEDATEFAWITAADVGNYDFIQGIDDEIKQVEKRLTSTSS